MTLVTAAKKYRFGITLTAVMLAMLVPISAWAAAGEILFVFGKANISNAAGQHTVLRGDDVDSGDLISTAGNGRVQIRMSDGGLIALRPNTQFRIDEYSFAAAESGSESSASETPDRSFYTLVKGGFRSITGAVGKNDKSAYRVRTPVATIGIRGTDYTAIYCSGDCSGLLDSSGTSLADGLYVGVIDGGVILMNDAGSLDVDPGEYAYVADENTAPVSSPDAQGVIMGFSGNDGTPTDDGEAVADNDDTPEVSVPLNGTDESGVDQDLTGGDDVVATEPGSVAFAAGPLESNPGVTGSATGDAGRLVRDHNGDLVQFGGDYPGESDSNYLIGSAEQVNQGGDAVTGIRWGRWSNGVISVAASDGSSSRDLDLGAGSLHWISDGSTPTLPKTGSLDFNLVGNTNPTDNQGNVGTLGTANLSADFDAQTVDADVSLSMDARNEIWDASAQDIDINSADATFDGAFDNVTITDTTDQSTMQGDGDLSGFFTGDGNGITGAGMGYSLENGTDTTISGAAAFRADPGN